MVRYLYQNLTQFFILYSCEEVRECSFCESGRLGCFQGDNSSTSGKLTLKEFINAIDSTSTLKDFYNTKIVEIKEVLLNLNKKVTDKATQIKINEISNLIFEADKSTKINDDHLVNLLQYYSLIEELKKSNGR